MGTSRFWFWWVWRAPDDARSVETLHFFLRKIFFFSSAVYALPLNSSFQRGGYLVLYVCGLNSLPFLLVCFVWAGRRAERQNDQRSALRPRAAPSRRPRGRGEGGKEGGRRRLTNRRKTTVPCWGLCTRVIGFRRHLKLLCFFWLAQLSRCFRSSQGWTASA